MRLTSAKERLRTASAFRISSQTEVARSSVGRSNMDAPTFPRMPMLRPGLNTDSHTLLLCFGCVLRLISLGASRAHVDPPLGESKEMPCMASS